ncbi:MAG: PadR family transcriptional regulator [Bryobacteraceae bacterium]
MDDPDRFLPLPPVMFEVLLCLLDGARHGYAIKREVAVRSSGKVRPGAGALYGAIDRMVEKGLLKESETRPDQHLDDERRRYYRLTALGRATAKAELWRLQALVEYCRSKAFFSGEEA